MNFNLTPKSNLVFAIIAILSIGFRATAGGTLFVDDDAAPGGNGASWDTAYRFLQDALADAAANGGVDEIRAAQGLYKPDQSEANPSGTGNRETKFQMLHGLALVGGYAGIGAEDPNARDYELYETILSGDIGEIDSIGDNSYHVISASGANQTVLLDGLIVTKGYASGASPNHRGGGLIIDNGIAEIINCTFLGNRSSGLTNLVAAGGAIAASNSDLILTNCDFIGNGVSGSDSQNFIGGGAISTSHSTITGIGCRFVSNYAVVSLNTGPAQGGAMRIVNSSVVTLSDCWFFNNEATRADEPNLPGTGGGLYVRESTASLTNCFIVGNMYRAHDGTGKGVGIYAQEADIALVNCLLSGNFMSGADGLGAGIYATGSNISVTNCTLTENNEGGILLENGSDLIADNTIMWGNTGGGNTPEEEQFRLDNSSTTTINFCNIQGWTGQFGGSGNIGKNPIFVGGPSGTWTEDDKTGSNLWERIYTDSNASFTPGEFVGNPINPNTSNTIQTFIVANSTTTITVLGFVPEVDAGDSYEILDYQFQPGSPSIDAADNTAFPGDIDTDLDGNPRYFDDPGTKDTGIGDPPIVDMGAYEFQGSSCPWDLDGSGSVGTNDLLELLAQWGNAGTADFDENGSVGTSDLLILLANWGPCL